MIIRAIKRRIYDFLDKPYFDAQISHGNEGIEVEVEYNDAFIRYLDANGYGGLATNEMKVDAYMANCWITAVNEEED